VTEDQKQLWWKSLPGVLTAATGFVAALSGLVAGLNQLGVFRREPAPAQVVGPGPTSRGVSARDSSEKVRGGSSSSAAGSGSDTGRSVTPGGAPPTSTSTRAPSHSTAPAGAPPTRADTAAEKAAAESLLPKGTSLDLEVRARTCAPSNGQKRFTARLASAVKDGGATVLPSGTTAVLHLRRAESSQPQVRLDSLIWTDLAVSVPSSNARVRRGADGEACLRAGARITATLGTSVPLPRR